MDRIREADKDDVGRVMIGGSYHTLPGVDIWTEYILCQIPFRQGFRLFDFDDLKAQFDAIYPDLKPGHHAKVKGQFYTDERSQEGIKIEDPLLLRIENYHLN